MRSSGPVNRRTLLAGLLGTAALAGCSAGVPGTGPVVLVSSVPSPVPPQPVAPPNVGASPAEIVDGFIQALGITQPDAAGAYSAARQFLTPQAQQTWEPDSRTPLVVVSQFRSDLVPESRNTVRVQVSPMARVDDTRAYRRVETDEPYQLQFALMRISGQWRISRVPDELVLTEESFRRQYVQRRVYFLDGSGTVAVPDLRYVLTTGTPLQRATRVLNLLLSGPSADLQGVVRNEVATVKLRRELSTEGGITRIDLVEAGDQLTPGQRRRLAAQLVWSLSQDLPSVRITLNDEPLDQTQDVWTTQTVGAFDPNGIPGGVAVVSEPYHVNSYEQLVALRTGQPVLGPLGDGSLEVASAAMSAATGRIAAVVNRRSDNTQELVVGLPGTADDLSTSIQADQLVSPVFGRDGTQVWVVTTDLDSGSSELQQVSVPTEAGEESVRVRVTVPKAVDLTKLRAFALSPDGVRIALAVGGQLLVGTVDTGVVRDLEDAAAAGTDPDADPSAAPQLTNLRLVRPELSDVAAVVFAGATELLVAAKTTSLYRSVYRVDLDGSEMGTTSSADLNGDVTAVAVNGPIDGAGSEVYAAFNGRIMLRVAGFTDGRWDNARPHVGVIAGSAPFYPR